MSSKKRKLEDDEETYLPRGGAPRTSDGVVAPKPKRPKTSERSDNLFKTVDETKKKKKKKKKSAKQELDSSEEAEENIMDIVDVDTAAEVEILRFSDLREGLLLMGTVREINELELIVNLPNNLKGVIKMPDISDTMLNLVQKEVERYEAGMPEDDTPLPTLSEMFYVGQFVRCAVVRLEETETTRRVLLTMRESIINRVSSLAALRPGVSIVGSIKSVEDHGYIVSLGLKNCTGFLPKEKATAVRPEGQAQPEKLHIGQPLEFVVTSLNVDSSTVFLDASHITLVRNKTKSTDIVSINNIQPGMRVSARVAKVLSNGLWLKFLGYFAGSVDMLHLDKIVNYDELAKEYKKGQKFDARVLSVDLDTKKITLTIQYHAINLRLPSFVNSSIEIGDIFEAATITRVDKSGIALRLPTDPPVDAYVHKTRVSDEQVKLKKFKVGEEVKCRILGYNYLSGYLTATMRKSDINEPFLRYSDVKVGQVVEGTITVVHEKGMQLKLSQGVKAFCPRTHFADVDVTDPERHGLKNGAKIRVRVMSVDPANKSVVVTHKKTLIKSELPLISTYEEAEVDMIVHGVIAAIKDFGCIVTLFGRVQGIVGPEDLGHGVTLENVRKTYRVGQVIKCIVKSVNPAMQKLKLSFNLTPSMTPEEKAKLKEKLQNYTPGMVTKGVVKSITPKGLEVKLKSGVYGFLATEHLSDHLANDELKEKYNVGQSIKKLVVLNVNMQKLKLVLSAKPLLCKAAADGQLPSQFSDLRKGQVYPGYVKAVVPYGVFVAFLGDLHGLAPKHLLADQFVADPADFYKKGQTVLARVQDLVEGDKNLVTLSLKPSEVSTGEFADAFDYNTSGYAKPIKPAENANATPAAASRPAASEDGSYPLTINDIKVGQEVKCKVQAIKPTHLTVSIGPNLFARLHMTEISDEPTPTNPLQRFELDQVIERARVIKITEKDSNKYLPLSHGQAKKQYLIDVTVRPSAFVKPPPYIGEHVEWSNLQKRRVYVGWIHQITTNDIWVQLSPTVRGRVYILDASNSVDVLRNIKKHFSPGQGVKCITLRVDADKKELDLSLKAVNQSPKIAATPEELKPGMVVPGRISRILLNVGLNIQLFGHTFGRAFLTDLSDKYTEDPLSQFAGREGDFVECCVTHVDKSTNTIGLSLRQSRINPGSAPEPKDPEIKSIHELVPGMAIRGYVKNILEDKHCLFVSLSRDISARVIFTDLKKKREEKVEDLYPVGKLVSGRIKSVDTERSLVEMTLRPEQVVSKLLFSDIQIGQKVKGVIKKIESFGIFIHIKNSSLVGLCHAAEILDDRTVTQAEMSQMFSVGDLVKAVVIRKNEEKKKISLSMKPSHFIEDDDSEAEDEQETKKGSASGAVVFAEGSGVSGEEEEEGEDDGEGEEDEEVDENLPILEPDEESSDDAFIRKVALHTSDSEVESDEEGEGEEEEGEGEDEEEEEAEDAMDVEENATKTGKPKSSEVNGTKATSSSKPVQVVVGELNDEGAVIAAPVASTNTFSVNELIYNRKEGEKNEDSFSDLESLDSDIEEEKKKPEEKKKKLKDLPTSELTDADILQRDIDLDERERAIAQGEAPKTADDFERLLVANPSSSRLWIQYMAYWAYHNDIGKARDTAERALKRIEQRQVKEKYNVWVAYMNLENRYGTPESLQTIFRRACVFNDAKDMHIELIRILIRSNKMKEAAETFDALIKKWKASKSVWIRYGEFKYRQGDVDGARALLDRALKSLAKRKHVALIIKFAQLEFKFGSPERGRTIFENVLTTYPKRVDIWSIYIDMELKVKEIQRVRAIFERVITLNLSSKKMKFFFKRYLTFEKQYGTPDLVAGVKDKAREWVERKASL